jgi:DUF1009 family protein
MQRTIDILNEYVSDNKKIIAILGVDGSPTCAINFCALGGGRGWTNERGIFMEELERQVQSRRLGIPFIGVSVLHIERALKDLRKVLLAPTAMRAQP